LVHSTAAPVPSVFSVEVKITPDKNEVLIIMKGPADGWFGFGFSAYRMADQPYTLIVEPESKHLVSEWRLGGHVRGLQLDAEAYVTWTAGSRHWVAGACAQREQNVNTWGWKFPGQEGVAVQCCIDPDQPDDITEDGMDGAGAGSIEEEGEAVCNRYKHPVEDKQCISGHFSAGFASDGVVGGASYANYSEAVAICAADGSRLCTRAELEEETSTGCCGRGCSMDTKVVWTSDVDKPVDPRMNVVSHSTSTDATTGKQVFEIKITRALTGDTANHYNFNPTLSEIPMIGARGSVPTGSSFIGDCGGGDFDCYHGPQQKLDLPLPVFEDKSRCVCKQSCTTSTTSTTTTSTATVTTKLGDTTTTTPAPRETVFDFGDIKNGADSLTDEELTAFANAVKQELAESLGVDVGSLDDIATVVLVENVDGTLTATIVWDESVDDATVDIQPLTVTVNGYTFGSTEVESGDSDTASAKKSTGAAIGGGVAGALLVVVIVAAVVVMKKRGVGGAGSVPQKSTLSLSSANGVVANGAKTMETDLSAAYEDAC
jgi:hypothetical protein